MGASSTLEHQINRLEEEITKERDCLEALMSTFRSQFTFLSDKFRALESGSTDIILWKLTSLKFVFANAKSAIRLDDAVKDPSTHYNSPLCCTHPRGYNFFVQLYLYGLDSAAETHASLMLALFPSNYDDFLGWPFLKTIHVSVHNQVYPHNKWTVTFAPSEGVTL